MGGKSSKEYKKLYYIRNKVSILSRMKETYEKNKDKYLLRVKKRRLKILYFPDLTVEEAWIEYQRLYELQKGLCAICNKQESKIDPQRNTACSLAVDHDHATKKVRGLLCFRCNTNLGWYESMKDNFSNYIKKAA